MGRHTLLRSAFTATAVVACIAVTGAVGASLGGLSSDELFSTSNAVPARAPTVVMADNFTTASLVDGRLPEHVGSAAWREVNGRWAVRNGYLDPPNSANALVLYPAGLGDLRVEVAATVTSGHRFGLVVRGTSTGPTYLVASVSSAGQAVISKAVSGVTSVLASAPFVTPLVQFTLGLTAVGGLLQLRSNGQLIVAHQLSPADVTTFGSLTDAGLWVSSSGNEQFDDFRITTVT